MTTTADTQSPWRTYQLGPVKPWVQFAGNQIGTLFKVTTEYGVAARAGDSDHPLGLAIDFMVYGDKQKGDQIAAYAMDNYKQLNIHYIIWYQKIWNWQRASEGWRLMPDRGSITANHMDHVHISFNASANGAGIPGWDPHDPAGIPNPLSGLTDPLQKVAGVLTWIGTGHNWFRIFLVLSGALLIGFALLHFDSMQSAASNISGKSGAVSTAISLAKKVK